MAKYGGNVTVFVSWRWDINILKTFVSIVDDLPVLAHGVFQGYLLEYREVKTDIPTYVKVLGDKRAWNLTELKPYRSYKVRIAAFTLEGLGKFGEQAWVNIPDLGKIKNLVHLVSVRSINQNSHREDSNVMVHNVNERLRRVIY